MHVEGIVQQEIKTWRPLYYLQLLLFAHLGHNSRLPRRKVMARILRRRNGPLRRRWRGTLTLASRIWQAPLRPTLVVFSRSLARLHPGYSVIPRVIEKGRQS